jgi:hypothetical protein
MSTETEQERLARCVDGLLAETEEVLAEALRRVQALQRGEVHEWAMMDDTISPSGALVNGARFPYLLDRALRGMREARGYRNQLTADTPADEPAT